MWCGVLDNSTKRLVDLNGLHYNFVQKNIKKAYAWKELQNIIKRLIKEKSKELHFKHKGCKGTISSNFQFNTPTFQHSYNKIGILSLLKVLPSR